MVGSEGRAWWAFQREGPSQVEVGTAKEKKENQEGK